LGSLVFPNALKATHYIATSAHCFTDVYCFTQTREWEIHGKSMGNPWEIPYSGHFMTSFIRFFIENRDCALHPIAMLVSRA
jgi:hypothetical protein